jgi:pseudaminic acid biosynthesis-associated methylase
VNTRAAQATNQIRTWSGDFGREYTDRNDYSPATLDSFYGQTYGISRRRLNEEFLRDIPKSASILEVGCNTGTQLLMLQEMGFTNLHGIEIQSYALEKAKARLPGVELSQASALAIPYPDGCFDLVFTSGVLIHIAPDDLRVAMSEIHRCTKQWIWGFEYYAPEMTEINYRGHENLLWKADYSRLYTECFADLERVKEQRVRISAITTTRMRCFCFGGSNAPGDWVAQRL